MAEQLLSVAMCTYNGARYLEEQLDSIASQTRQPDELVVCDDQSLDSTVEIIKAFQYNTAFPVRLLINEKKLGSTKNFEKAVSLCTGDIIALSDQDDVWQPDKLKLIEEKFRGSPNAGIVFSDAEIVDELLRPLGYRLWQAKGFSPAEQKKITQGRSLEVLLKHNIVTGAAAAFRAKFRELFLPIPASWVHDAWIALIIAVYADLDAIYDPLIKYRQHSNQQIGAIKKGFMEQMALSYQTDAKAYIRHLERYKDLRERLSANTNVLHNSEVISRLEAKMAHLTVRFSMPAPKLKRLSVVINELLTLRYHRYSYGWKSAVKDLFFTKASHDGRIVCESGVWGGNE